VLWCPSVKSLVPAAVALGALYGASAAGCDDDREEETGEVVKRLIDPD
jgi:hypothetical protein